MDNLDQGFFSSGLDSFDMGVIQNRPNSQRSSRFFPNISKLEAFPFSS